MWRPDQIIVKLDGKTIGEATLPTIHGDARGGKLRQIFLETAEMIAFSFVNLAAAASLAASTTFTEVEAAVGLRHPERPHLRGYTTDLSEGRVTLDFGVATALDVVALVHANFTIARVQGHSADTWGAPAYDTPALPIGRAGTDRHQHAHRPTLAVPFFQRYASLRVPTRRHEAARATRSAGSGPARSCPAPGDSLRASRSASSRPARTSRPRTAACSSASSWTIRRGA